MSASELGSRLPELCWSNSEKEFVRAIDAILSHHKGKVAIKRDALIALVKIAFQAGLDKGHDMAKQAYSDG